MKKSFVPRACRYRDFVQLRSGDVICHYKGQNTCNPTTCPIMNYTSYFAKGPQLINADLVPIAITATVPEWFKGLTYQKLAPSYDILMEYKKTGDRDRYTHRFMYEILYKLKPDEVYNELMELTGGKHFCLVCYEKPDSFCHRHLVADWLSINGYPCKETYVGG